MLIKICGIAILCVISLALLKSMNTETAIFVRIAGGVLIFALVVTTLGDIFVDVRELIESVGGGGIDEYASVMLKALGVALIGKICSDICKDCGEGSIAGGVELAAKGAILLLSIPLIGEIIEYAAQILEME